MRTQHGWMRRQGAEGLPQTRKLEEVDGQLREAKADRKESRA